MSAMRLVRVRIEVDGCAHKWTAYKTTGLVNSNYVASNCLAMKLEPTVGDCAKRLCAN